MDEPLIVTVETTMSTVGTSLVTAMTSVADQSLSAISAIVPVAAPVLGAILIIGIGIKAFRKIAH